MMLGVEFWLGRKHGDHRDAPPWLIALLIVSWPVLIFGILWLIIVVGNSLS